MQNKYAVWFSRVVWLGIVFNLLFVAAQWVAPNMVNVGLDVPVTTSTVWNVGHGAMVLALSLLYIPAAVNPLQYPMYSWLIVVSRLLAAILWATISVSNPAFIGALIMDGGFGVVEGILLQLALPERSKLSGPNFGRLFQRMGNGLRSGFASPVVRVGLLVIVAIVAVLGYVLWYNLMRAEPDPQYASVEEHFKYGAIGLGSDSRIPYWIWKVLPDMFPEKLPAQQGGWASLGLIMEDGHDLPVGFAHRKIGYDSVEANCALCHTAQFRRTAAGKEEIVLGGPAHTLDLQAFQRFLYAAVADPRFTPDNVIAAVNRVHHLSFIEAAMYRYLIVPATKEGLLEQKIAYSWQDCRPQQGRGRTDTFNPTKFNVFHMADDNTIGTVDLPQIWNQKPRETMYLHWDGNNNNIHERNFAAAMAIGATPKTVILPSFNRVTGFLWTLQPAGYPFPIDQAAAGRGKPVFDQQCASCHAFGGKYTGQVENIAQIGTDRHRLDSFSAALVDRFHSINQPPFKFDAYRKTNGYANVPLDGIWVRAPYLHNGSVPNMVALLEAPENRPVTFYRGYDVYDPEHVGFISQGPEAARVGFFVDTNIPGNSNQGHLYGTDLAPAQKRDLIEYLKTL
jgi:hypothetical protein